MKPNVNRDETSGFKRVKGALMVLKPLVSSENWKWQYCVKPLVSSGIGECKFRDQKNLSWRYLCYILVPGFKQIVRFLSQILKHEKKKEDWLLELTPAARGRVPGGMIHAT